MSLFRYILSVFIVPLLIISSFSGCVFINIFGSKPKKTTSYRKDYEPISHQVSLIESSSSDEVLISATGKGEDLETALKDSKLAGLWFVLEGGKSRLLSSSSEKNSFAKFGEKYYTNVDNYIAFSSQIKSKRVENDTYFVTKNYKVNIRMLKEDLSYDGVIKSIEDIASDLQQPAISLVPRDSKTKFFEFSSDVVASYLTEQGFEVESLNAKGIDKVISKSMALSGDIDPSYLLAVEAGSDIYISVNSTVDESYKYHKRYKKASVSLTAYNTVTKKQIASATGHSQEIATSSDNAVLEEATNDASNQLLSQISRSWKSEIQRGKYFRLILKTPFDNASNIIYNLLSKNCSNINRVAGQNLYNYKMQCKNVKNSVELLQLIQNNYTGEGAVFRELDSNSLLILKISNSESDDIEIF